MDNKQVNPQKPNDSFVIGGGSLMAVLIGTVTTAAVVGAKATAEVSKPTSITKVTDEMKADPYHPDWQRYVGNEPRAVGADVVGGGAKGLDKIFETGRTQKSK